MKAFVPAAVLFGAALILLGSIDGAKAQNVRARQYYTKTWEYKKTTNYHVKTYHYKVKATDTTYKHQYVIYKPTVSKNYVYWYNPDTKKYWARCPTVNHPTYGKDVKAGKDFWGIAHQDKRTDNLETMKEEHYGKTEQKSPNIPQSEDKMTIECPPIDLPKA